MLTIYHFHGPPKIYPFSHTTLHRHSGSEMLKPNMCTKVVVVGGVEFGPTRFKWTLDGQGEHDAAFCLKCFDGEQGIFPNVMVRSEVLVEYGVDVEGFAFLTLAKVTSDMG
jgi:hypothetical protein